MTSKRSLLRSGRSKVVVSLAAASVIAVTVTGVVLSQQGGQRRRATVIAPNTTSPPETVPLFIEPLPTEITSTTATTVAAPADTEPSVPATPTPPTATPVLAANGPAAPVFYRLRISAPVVFVTIDDGWVRDARIVDFIRQSGWPISIFLIERAASGDPNYFRQLSAAGATIEDHTFDHPYLTSLGADRQTYEICRPEHDYVGMFGRAPTLVRPPYGAWNPTTEKVAHSCGLGAVVEWSATMSAGRLAISGSPRLRGGDIILLHFNANLYNDLVTLRKTLVTSGLAVGKLESYLSAPTAGG